MVTGWGESAAALPPDAVRAAAGRRLIAARRSMATGERFRRATRECLLGIGAVEALLREGGLGREAIRGDATALVYVSAAAYGSSNRGFIEAEAARPVHFPYTAPSAVPAGVAIEVGLTGPYVIPVGGAARCIAGRSTGSAP